ncbi:nucleoside/nucleotide kinase family protein [Streptomyces olivaceus]|uniref:hypothetical protein n=1 Tax=Streptomyces olivaceus TaxID=47716 RepID=UPI0036C88C86
MSDRRTHPFIAIEGTDGSGKSTLRNLLHDGLNRDGQRCFMVGQHSWLDVDAGRVILAARTQQHGIGRAELMRAYARDKHLHLTRNIQPALATVAVLADRYIYSDAVYHQVLYGIPAEETLAHHRSIGTVQPDVVVFVDTAPSLASDRTVTRGMNLRPHETPETIRALHQGYVDLFSGNRLGPDGPEILRVDNNGTDPEATAQHVLTWLKRFYNESLNKEVASVRS